MSHDYFHQVVEGSQYYDNLNQIYHAIWMLRASQTEAGQLDRLTEDELAKILTGIDNTINQGYKLIKE